MITKTVLWMTVAAGLMAQPPPGDGRPWDQGPGGPPPGMQPNRPPMQRRFGSMPPGKWWTDAGLIQRLELTPDQQKKMDAIFQQSRLKLIDLTAVLQKEEAILEPMLEEDRPEEAKVLQQIDRIAQARAELEKANARMLLGFRGVLTTEQRKKLEEDRGRLRPHPEDRRPDDHR